MIGYVANITELSDENIHFRRVLYTGSTLQLVLVSVEPGQELGGEIHAETDQIWRIEAGKGRIVIDGAPHKIEVGDICVVPAGAHHNVICTGHEAFKLCTIYGPPRYRDQLVQTTNAGAADGVFDGQITEHAAAAVRV